MRRCRSVTARFEQDGRRPIANIDQAALVDDAARVRQELREVGNALVGFPVAAREVGATSDQVATLVGSLRRIAIASGASPREERFFRPASCPGAGLCTLQGDELRSIVRRHHRWDRMSERRHRAQAAASGVPCLRRTARIERSARQSVPAARRGWAVP